MLFPTTDFAIFFCVVFLGHWLLQPTPTRWKIFMVAASYVFYGWWDWH
jgi:alginate O-acetyltransferase complex protein AlgI